MTTRTLRVAFAFLIAGSLATAALPAGPLFESAASPAAFVAADSLNLLERLWNVLTRFQVKNGCSADPSGQCLPKSRGVERKNGCQVDPNGRCLTAAAVTADNGCQVDPSGRCLLGTAVTADNGCSVDPDGRCGR